MAGELEAVQNCPEPPPAALAKNIIFRFRSRNRPENSFHFGLNIIPPSGGSITPDAMRKAFPHNEMMEEQPPEPPKSFEGRVQIVSLASLLSDEELVPTKLNPQVFRQTMRDALVAKFQGTPLCPEEAALLPCTDAQAELCDRGVRAAFKFMESYAIAKLTTMVGTNLTVFGIWNRVADIVPFDRNLTFGPREMQDLINLYGPDSGGKALFATMLLTHHIAKVMPKDDGLYKLEEKLKAVVVNPGLVHINAEWDPMLGGGGISAAEKAKIQSLARGIGRRLPGGINDYAIFRYGMLACLQYGGMSMAQRARLESGRLPFKNGFHPMDALELLWEQYRGSEFSKDRVGKAAGRIYDFLKKLRGTNPDGSGLGLIDATGDVQTPFVLMAGIDPFAAGNLDVLGPGGATEKRARDRLWHLGLFNKASESMFKTWGEFKASNITAFIWDLAKAVRKASGADPKAPVASPRNYYMEISDGDLDNGKNGGQSHVSLLGFEAVKVLILSQLGGAKPEDVRDGVLGANLDKLNDPQSRVKYHRPGITGGWAVPELMHQAKIITQQASRDAFNAKVDDKSAANLPVKNVLLKGLEGGADTLVKMMKIVKH